MFFLHIYEKFCNFAVEIGTSVSGAFIQEHQHLPEIPSAQQMQEDGMSVDQMVVKLLQKIEELTLYIIRQDERIRDLEKQLSK